MRDEPKVGIVLLNWNGYDDTSKCLQSLSDVQYENRFTVIVDNDSSDGSGERLASEFPESTVLFNEENRGFAGGCNVGIDHCLDEGADYVLLLNNDIEVTPDFLEPLVRAAEDRESVALVGGIIYEENGEVWDAGGEMRPFIASFTKYKQVQADEVYPTDFVTCAMNLLSKEFLADHRLDEGFFFGVEEVDLSWRARTDGWKLLIAPDSEVYHKVGSALEDTFAGEQLFSPFQKYHNTRGRLYHSMKNLRSYHTVVYLLLAISAYSAIYAWWGIRYGRSDIIYAHLLSLYDYFLGTGFRRPGYFG